MKNAKKTNINRKALVKDIAKIKEGRLSGPYKDSMVEILCREALVVNPELTRTQLQRIFSHAYQALRKEDGDTMIRRAKQQAIQKFIGTEIRNTESKLYLLKPMKKALSDIPALVISNKRR